MIDAQSTNAPDHLRRSVIGNVMRRGHVSFVVAPFVIDSVAVTFIVASVTYPVADRIALVPVHPSPNLLSFNCLLANLRCV